MNSDDRKLRTINDVLIYLTVIICLILFTLASFPQLNFLINESQMIILVVIVILLLFRHFSKIEIPGLLALTKRVEEVRDEARELRLSLNQVLAKAQATSSAVVNINQMVHDYAQDAKEIGTEIAEPLRRSERLQTEADRIKRFVSDGEYVAAFAVLRKSIQVLLQEILRIKTGSETEYRSWLETVRTIRELGILKPSILDAIAIVRNTANTILHSGEYEKAISADEATAISDLGLRVISELNYTKEYLMKHKEYFVGAK